MPDSADTVHHTYVVECLIHIVATNAAEAEAIIERACSVVFDAGPVTITSDRGALELLYINAPQDELTEMDAAYDYPIHPHRSDGTT